MLDEQDHEDRERYRELLEELRSVLPGVQVLFAFLLTAPFSDRFADLDAIGRNGYLIALVSAAVSTLLFMAPAPHHRLAPQEDRARRVRRGVRLALGGIAALAVAMAAALFVITRFVFGGAEAAVLTAALVVAVAALWYAIPLRARR